MGDNLAMHDVATAAATDVEPARNLRPGAVEPAGDAIRTVDASVTAQLPACVADQPALLRNRPTPRRSL